MYFKENFTKKEKNQVPADVCSFLGLKRRIILEILKEYNVTVDLSFQEVKDWCYNVLMFFMTF